MPAHHPEEKRHWVRITSACNNHCIFCLDRENLDGAILPFEQIVESLKQGRSANAVRAVISGGEPTIHPDFTRIVGAASGMGYAWVQCISNGRMFYYRSFLEDAVRAGLREITFSIHGHNKNLFEKLTGVPGSFRQTMGALKNALAMPDLVVSADIVVNKLNACSLSDIVKFLVRLGVREFDLLHIVPFGGAWRSKEHLLCGHGDYIEEFHRTFEIGRRSDIHMWTNRFPPHLLEGYEHMIQFPSKIHDEVNGRRDLITACLEKDVPMHCQGERCTYCNMLQFCEMLNQLRSIVKSGGPIDFSLDAANAHLLVRIPRHRIRSLFVEQGDNDAVQGAVKKMCEGIPCTFLVEDVETADLMPAYATEFAIAINRRTAGAITKGKIPHFGGRPVSLLSVNRQHHEDCVERDIPIRSFFDYCPPQYIKGLAVTNVPQCIVRRAAFSERPILWPSIFPLSDVWDLRALTDYFIRCRYYVKSARCMGCRVYSSCLGIHINRAIAFGFKEISGAVTSRP